MIDFWSLIFIHTIDSKIISSKSIVNILYFSPKLFAYQKLIIIRVLKYVYIRTENKTIPFVINYVINNVSAQKL